MSERNSGANVVQVSSLGSAERSEILAVEEIRMLRDHLSQRAMLCYAMVFGGLVCLLAGAAMLVVGLSGDQVIWFQTTSLKVTAGGFGAVTMLASVAWGYVAFLSRPIIHFRGAGRGPGADGRELVPDDAVIRMEWGAEDRERK